VENQEGFITSLFQRSSFGQRHFGDQRHPSEDFYHLVFEPPPSQRAQEALDRGLKLLSRTDVQLDNSAVVTALPPGSTAGSRVTRQVRRRKAEGAKPPLDADVKNMLARLKLQCYENVFRDWWVVGCASRFRSCSLLGLTVPPPFVFGLSIPSVRQGLLLIGHRDALE